MHVIHTPLKPNNTTCWKYIQFALYKGKDSAILSYYSTQPAGLAHCTSHFLHVRAQIGSDHGSSVRWWSRGTLLHRHRHHVIHQYQTHHSSPHCLHNAEANGDEEEWSIDGVQDWEIGVLQETWVKVTNVKNDTKISRGHEGMMRRFTMMVIDIADTASCRYVHDSQATRPSSSRETIPSGSQWNRTFPRYSAS